MIEKTTTGVVIPLMLKIVRSAEKPYVSFSTYLLLFEQFVHEIYIVITSTGVISTRSNLFEGFWLTGTSWWAGFLLGATVLSLFGLATRRALEIKIGAVLGFLLWSHAAASLIMMNIFDMSLILCVFNLIFFGFLYIKSFFFLGKNNDNCQKDPARTNPKRA